MTKYRRRSLIVWWRAGAVREKASMTLWAWAAEKDGMVERIRGDEGVGGKLVVGAGGDNDEY